MANIDALYKHGVIISQVIERAINIGKATTYERHF